MISKVIILSVFLMSCATANIEDIFLAKVAKYDEINPCNGLNGVFATNTRGCSWYHVCVNQISIRQDRCPEGFHFSEVGQGCAPKGISTCTINNNVEPNCKASRRISFVPHPHSCSKYIICFDGVENDRDCPRGLHFSSYDNKCVIPFLADCDIEANACSESVETGLPVLIPNTRNCRSYFMCIGDRNAELTCPPLTHFDPDLGWCTNPEYVDCTPIKREGQPIIPDKISIDCDGLNGTSVAHPDSCQFYFFCAGPISFLQVCGENLLFDFNTEKCQNKEIATCFYDTQTTAEPETTVEGGPTTEEPITDETTEEPITEEPITDETTEEPITDDETTEEPITEEPITEEPITDETTEVPMIQ